MIGSKETMKQARNESMNEASKQVRREGRREGNLIYKKGSSKNKMIYFFKFKVIL